MVPGLRIDPIKERHYGRWFVAAAMVGLLGVLGWFIYGWYTTGAQPPIPLPLASADPRVDESDVSKQAVATHTVPATEPRYISIPSIDVQKARIFSVGLTKNNLLDTPKNIHDTAWYKKSASPGQGYGAVLINAHNGGITKDGVFARLVELEEGAEIEIERGDGQTYSYTVTDNRTMDLEEVNKTGMKMMMKSAEATKEGLNLITCAGTWVPRMQQFDKRIMLRAVAKEPTKQT